MADANDKLTVQNAMKAFHDYIEEAEQAIAAVPGLTAEEVADGYAYLVALLPKMVEFTMANADTEHPQFRRLQDTLWKFGLDNPDNLYTYARIDDSGDYRIHGTRGSATEFLFQVIAGFPGDGSLGTIYDTLDYDRLRVNPDGSFEVVVSVQPRQGNWLKSGPGASFVIGRQTFTDWTWQKKGEVFIERIGSAGSPARRVTADEIAHRVAETGRLLNAHIRYWIQFNENMIGPAPVNALAKPWPTVGGIAGQWLTAGKFNLADDQALVLTFAPSHCRYMNILLADLWWFITFDYRDRHSSVAFPGQAHLGSDGNYHYVVSKYDPGVPNWLDTCEHERGTIFVRWQGLSGASPTQPAVKLVNFTEVRKELPDDEPIVTPEERRRIIAARALAMDRRYCI
jgi:hypothetical protein